MILTCPLVYFSSVGCQSVRSALLADWRCLDKVSDLKCRACNEWCEVFGCFALNCNIVYTLDSKFTALLVDIVLAGLQLYVNLLPLHILGAVLWSTAS